MECAIAFILALIIISVMIQSSSEKKEEKRNELDALNNDINDIVYACIVEHLQTLREKEKQCTYYDDYGNIKTDDFRSEFEYFVRNVVYKILRDFMDDYDKNGIMDLFIQRCLLVYEIVKIHSCHSEFYSDFTGVGGNIRKRMADNSIEFPKPIRLKKSIEISRVLTGEDYERYIQNCVENEGFLANLTPTTGDQGCDLIVQTRHGKVAVQCKYYSSKVGNQAVQEISAGKVFYNCSYAVVVSNAGYTTSARRLSHSLGVFLCNEDSLIALLKEIDADD